MITALIDDAVLRSALEVAARWDEDVLVDRREVARAVRVAHPRVLVIDDERGRATVLEDARERAIPVLVVGPGDVEAWEARRRERVPPPGRARFYGTQLRTLLPAGPASWVDRLLADLARALGRPLPAAFRLVARRVLEDPSRYTTLEALGPVVGLSSAALRARFRRRDLPSPLEYLQGLRLLAVAHRLETTRETVSAAAEALGFHSSGNLARFTRAACGRVPSELRVSGITTVLLLRFASTLLRPEWVDAWRSLDSVFVEEA